MTQGEWKQVGQLRVPPEPLEVSDAVAPRLADAIEAEEDRELIRLEWSWDLSEIVLDVADVAGTRYYLAIGDGRRHLVATSSTADVNSDREFLDLFFDLTWEEWGLTVINAPTDISWAQPFSLDDVVEWLARAYHQYPEMWDETLHDNVYDTDKWEGWPDLELPPKPEPPALEGEEEARRELEEEEPDPGQSGLRAWEVNERRARIEGELESWRQEQDPIYAAAYEQWESEVERIETEQEPQRLPLRPQFERHLIRRYLTEYVGLSE